MDDNYDDDDLDGDLLDDVMANDDADLVDDNELESNEERTVDNVTKGKRKATDDPMMIRRHQRRRRMIAKMRSRQERQLMERELSSAAEAAASRRVVNTAASVTPSVDDRRASSGTSPPRSDDEDRVLDFGMKKRRLSGSGSDDNGRNGARDDIGGAGAYSCGSDEDGASSSPIEQTEIKLQRPLGLLAQHGLSIKSGTGQMQQQHHALPGSVRPHHHLQQHGAGPMFQHLDRAPSDFEREMIQQAMQAHGTAVSLHQAAVVAAATAADKDGRLFGLGAHQPGNGLAGMRVDFGGGPPMNSGTTPLSLMDRRFMPSPPPNGSSTPLGCSGLDPNKAASNGAGSPGAHHWTFEEQFKQVCHSLVIMQRVIAA